MRPRSTTSAPSAVAPSAKAAESSTPGGPHVAAHQDAGGAGEAGEGGADGPGHGRVELVGDHAPDVVRLEDLGTDPTSPVLCSPAAHRGHSSWGRMRPVISVVMPAHDEEAFLAAAVGEVVRGPPRAGAAPSRSSSSRTGPPTPPRRWRPSWPASTPRSARSRSTRPTTATPCARAFSSPRARRWPSSTSTTTTWASSPTPSRPSTSRRAVDRRRAASGGRGRSTPGPGRGRW